MNIPMNRPRIALHIMHSVVVAAITMSVAPATSIDFGTAAPPPPISTATAQVNEMTKGMDCTTEPFLTDNIFVVTLATDKVSKVTFDEALNLTKTGTVKVMTYCH